MSCTSSHTTNNSLLIQYSTGFKQISNQKASSLTHNQTFRLKPAVLSYHYVPFCLNTTF